MKKVCIVHYNTPELTRAAVLSVRKWTADVAVTVFDNSDRRAFGDMDGVTVIDNTRGQVINFERWLRQFHDRLPREDANNWASAKHCYSVQWLVDHVGGPFVLMDSDALAKRDLTPLWDAQQVFVGQVIHCKRKWQMVDLVYPYICYLNAPMIAVSGVTYFRGDRMYALTHEKPYVGYDTGAWFLEDCRAHALPYRDIKYGDYIEHFGHASWQERSSKEWLQQHRKLWE